MQTQILSLPCVTFVVGASVLFCASTASADDFAVGIDIKTEEASENECEAEGQVIPEHCKRGRFVLRAGFDPDEGWVAGASVGNDHLFGSDHRLTLTAELSERRQEFRTDYDVPTLFGSGLDFHAESFTRRLSFRHFEQENTGVAMHFGRALSPNLTATIGYRLQQIETNRLATTETAKVVRDPLNESGILATLELGLRFDDRDASRMGSTVSLLASQSDSRFGSDYQLTKLSAIATHTAPLIGPLTLNLRGHGESIVGHDGNKIPLAERLQWGGHSDVRGYGLGSTGPTLGGDFKAGGQAELFFPLISRLGLSGALFYDVGFVSAEQLSPGKIEGTLRQSVGAGLRWETPLGPLAVDLALPLGDPETPPAVLFSIGNSF